jgi:hypothetical protein
MSGTTQELTISRIGRQESNGDLFLDHPVVEFVRASLGPPVQVWSRPSAPDGREAIADALPGSLPWRALRNASPPLSEDAEDKGAVLLEQIQDEQHRQKRLHALRERRERGAYHALLCHRGDDLDRARFLAAELAECGLLLWVDQAGALARSEADPMLLDFARKSGVIATLIGRSAHLSWSEHDFYPFYRDLTTTRWDTARRLRWIPVVLPEAPGHPVMPDFLHSFDWIQWADKPLAARQNARTAFVSAVLRDRSRS